MRDTSMEDLDSEQLAYMSVLSPWYSVGGGAKLIKGLELQLRSA